MSRHLSRRAAGAVVALVLLPVSACGLAPGATDESSPSAAQPEPASSSSSDDDRVQSVEIDARPEVAAPRRVSIPDIGVDSALEDLRTDDAGRLASPEEWQQAGWFADGVEPGAVGPAVIAGHVDSPTGPAVFADLDELEPGDVVEIEREDGTSVRFEVDRTEVVGKDDFPTDAVYGPTPDAQLRLITCDGAYVSGAGGYQENLVVWATETDQ
jgi:LPXTG-site transpeptidase (sortase) family protein